MPTEDERKKAAEVLRAYLPQAVALLEKTDQERPAEWCRGIEVCIDLLKEDPKQVMDDYEAEFDAGQ